MSNFCEQNGSSPIAPSRKKGKKHDKSHAKEKIVSEKYDKQPGKNKFNIDNKDQEELFKILESNNSFDSLKDDFSS